MSESIFSALKVVAMMLAVDHDIDAKERAWFMAVMNSFGVNYSQRNSLRDLLRGRSKEDLRTVLNEITDLKDQQRLANFLKVAMKIDGVAKPSEIEFYSKVQSLLGESDANIDYLSYGREVLKRDKELQLWMALGNFGKAMSQRRHGFLFHFPMHLGWDLYLFPALLLELFIYEKRSYFLITFIFIIIVFLLIIRKT